MQKALHVAAPETFGNGGWMFRVSGIEATNHFYVMVNGVRSNVVAAVIEGPPESHLPRGRR